MKRAFQFRYYGSQHSQNYPYDKFYNYYGQLVSGNIFQDYGTITHLGIQAPPGTMFRLNNGESWITVGSTGIYELDLSGLSYISDIKFDAACLQLLEKNNTTNRGILIDIIYDGIEVNQ